MNDRLDLQRLTAAILRRWVVVVFVTVIIVGLGYAATRAQTATYQARTSVLVGQEPPGVVIENSDRAMKEQLALTFAELAVRAPVLQPAAEELGLGDDWHSLRPKVAVRLAPHTLLLDIEVTGSSPEAAALAADEVADQLVAVSQTLGPYRQVKVGSATADSRPIGPNSRMNMLFYGIIGFIVASAVALVLELARERKRRTFRSNEDIPFLGVINARRGRTATTLDAAASEEAAAILNNLRVACRPNSIRTMVVTGQSNAERSRAAVQLAMTLAHGTVRTVLVDLGLREPTIHRHFDLPLVPGVSELLEERAPRRNLVRRVTDYLGVLPAGNPSVNPSLLLSPEAVDRIAASADAAGHTIVFDVPLTDRIAELGLVAERVDAVVLVIRNRLTRNEERRVGEELMALGVQPNGVVVVRTGFFARLLDGPADDGSPGDAPGDVRSLIVVEPETTPPTPGRRHQGPIAPAAETAPPDPAATAPTRRPSPVKTDPDAAAATKPRRRPTNRSPRRSDATAVDDFGGRTNGHDPTYDPSGGVEGNGNGDAGRRRQSQRPAGDDVERRGDV